MDAYCMGVLEANYNSVHRTNGRLTEKDLIPKYEVGLSADKRLPASEEDKKKCRKVIEDAIDKKIKDDIIAVIDTLNEDHSLGLLIIKNEPTVWEETEEKGRYILSGRKVLSMVGYGEDHISSKTKIEINK